jgi:methionyl aminopeptidase
LERAEEGYNVILPAEPFVYGVHHIQPRVVPDHILRPPYARGIPAPAATEISLQENGKIELGGEAELKTREAALLAKKVREFAGTQVKVRGLFVHSRKNH